MNHILPDVLDYNLRIVFCGTAAGDVSAMRGAYYAGPGNRFWATLFKIGLTDRKLPPENFRDVLKYGIGLTDLAKSSYGADSTLAHSAFDIDSFREKMLKHSPSMIAFNGKKSAKTFLQHDISYGIKEEKIGASVIFVLPSTSGAARKFWDESYWMALRQYI